MKKLIAFLLITILIAFTALYIAPQLYLRHSSDQYLQQGKSLLSKGEVRNGIEKLRLSIHIAGDSTMFRCEVFDRTPEILLNTALRYPLRSDEILSFAAQNNVSFPCGARTNILSSLLEDTYSLFLRKTAGAGTTEKIRQIEANLSAAAEWAADCELDPETKTKFTTYKRAYEKLSGKPFVERPISKTLPPEPPPPPPAEPPAPKSRLSSILDTPKSIYSSIKNSISSKLGKATPPAKQQQTPPPPVAPAPSQIGQQAPPPPAAPPTPPPQQPPPEQKFPLWMSKLKGDLEAAGIKPVRLETPGDRSLRLSIQTPREGADLIAELKMIFEIVDRNVADNRLLDKIVYLNLDVLAADNRKTAGWIITLNDYRLYRVGEITGKEFMERMTPSL